MDLQSLISALIGTIAGGGAGWCLRATRRKASAEASVSELVVTQNALTQIADLQQDVREKNLAIKDLNSEMLDLSRRLIRLELDFERYGCYNLQCPRRKNILRQEREEDSEG